LAEEAAAAAERAPGRGARTLGGRTPAAAPAALEKEEGVVETVVDAGRVPEGGAL